MEPTFPPPYSIRISKRARKPGLRIAPHVGLEVVLPKPLNNSDVAALVQRHRQWIERHYERIMQPVSAPASLEDGFFIGGGKTFISFSPRPLTQEYLHQQAKKILPGVITPRRIDQRHEEVFTAYGTDKTHLYDTLRQWVLGQAEVLFRPQLEALVEQEGLTINRCVFKLQKTRWGSCSIKKNININANIIFLPEKLARYILIHELCHLHHLNHSSLFWKKVFEMEPQALQFDKALRHAKKYLPWHRLSS